MPNILQQAEMLKDVSDQRIQQEMQRPTGQFPLYLVSSEAKRRADLRQRFKAEQSGPPPQTTVQQDLMAALAGQTPPMAQPISPNRAVAPGQGAGSPLNPQGTPPTGVPLPPPQRGFAQGGQVRGYENGGLLDLGVGTSPFSGFSYDPYRVPAPGTGPRLYDPARLPTTTFGKFMRKQGLAHPDITRREQEGAAIDLRRAQDEARYLKLASDPSQVSDFGTRPTDTLTTDIDPGRYGMPIVPPKFDDTFASVTDEAGMPDASLQAPPPAPPQTAAASGLGGIKRRTEAELLADAQRQLGFAATQPAAAATPPGEAAFDPYNFTPKGPDPYAKVKEQLAERKASAASDKDMNIGLAIAGIGAGIAGGESQFAATNIGEGFSKGLPGLQKVFTEARARKDKDIALDTAMISADQAYKSAERKFALDVRSGDRTYENAQQQLQLKQSELLSNTVNKMREGDYKERVLDETARHHAALIKKPGGTVAALQMVLDAKPEDLEKILKYSKTGKTLDQTTLVNGMSEWRKITKELGLTAKSSTEDWKQAIARLNTAVPGSAAYNNFWMSSRGMLVGKRDNKIGTANKAGVFTYGGSNTAGG